MNEKHSIRHIFTNRRIKDEYAMRKGTPSPIFMKTVDKFRELGVDTWRVETATNYNQAPWMVDADKCLDLTMCSITKRGSRERIVAECTATLEGESNERLKIFTAGSLKDERVGYAIVTPETMIKNRIRIETAIFSAKQEAIIKAIYISKGKRATVIATDSLSTMITVEGTRWTKNPKTRRIRELLDKEKVRVKLMWIPSHSGNTKNALEEDINHRELYPPQDLINWMKKTHANNKKERWAK
jgi:CRISPR/Cas system CMR-associated protein Cmr5 small subunit